MGKIRKYYSETGLNVSLDHFTLVQAERLMYQAKNDENKYHLYMICCAPQAYIDLEKTIVINQPNEKGIAISLFSFDEQGNKKVYPTFAAPLDDANNSVKLDYSKVKLTSVYPATSLQILLNDKEYTTANNIPARPYILLRIFC